MSSHTFERVYEVRKKVVPADLNHAAAVKDAEAYFARKALAFRAPCRAKTWADWYSYFIGRTVDKAQAEHRLTAMIEAGEAVSLSLEGEKEVHYVPAADLPVLETVHRGDVPEAWRPIDTTTREEVTFLAPLETVTAYGRAKKLFGFEYIWEVYKPADQRRWGYYTLPILYGDRLVARIDPKFDRAAGTMVIRGFWLEDPRTGTVPAFATALSRGLLRLADFISARRIDISHLKPTSLRKMIQPEMKQYTTRIKQGTRGTS